MSGIIKSSSQVLACQCTDFKMAPFLAILFILIVATGKTSETEQLRIGSRVVNISQTLQPAIREIQKFLYESNPNLFRSESKNGTNFLLDFLEHFRFTDVTIVALNTNFRSESAKLVIGGFKKQTFSFCFSNVLQVPSKNVFSSWISGSSIPGQKLSTSKDARAKKKFFHTIFITTIKHASRNKTLG